MDLAARRSMTVLAFTDTARYQAFRIARDRSRVVADDLVQDVYVTLLELYDRDPNAFQRAAPHYVKKALHEGLAQQVGESLSVRRFLRKFEETRGRLRLELWREPNEDEIARAMKMHVDSLRIRRMTGRVMRALQGTSNEPTAQHWSGRINPTRPKGQPFKLTDAQVAEVRRRAAAGESRKSLSQAFGLSKTPIAKILRGDSRPALRGAA